MEPQRVYQAVAEEALALAEALGDRRRAARVCVMASDALVRYSAGAVGASPALRQWTERLDRYADPDTPERVRVDHSLRSQRFLAARWAEAYALQVRALEQARRLNDPDLLFYAAGLNMSPGYVPPRHHQEMLRLADEFSTRSREGASVTTIAALLSECQAVYLQAGDRARVEELWHEIEELSQRTRDPVLLLWPLVHDTIRATLEGELEEAIANGERLAERGAELGSPVRGRFFADQLAFWPFIYLGRAEEALATLANPRRSEGALGWSEMRFGRVGLCLAMVGRLDEAWTRLREALQRFRVSIERDEVFAIVLADLLASAVAAEDREAMALLRERLAGIAAVGQNPSATPTNVARFLGAAAALLGDREAAREDYERSLAWATTIRHRPEVALTRLQIAELLLDEANSSQPSAISHQRPTRRSGGGGGDADG